MNLHILPIRPKTRGDCKHGVRPCPWVSCRHHLHLDVSAGGGAITERFDIDSDAEPKETCSLDVADRGEHTLEQIAEYMGIRRQGAHQLEQSALYQLAKNYEMRRMRGHE